MTKNTPKTRGYLAEKSFSGVFLYRKSNKLIYLVSFEYKNKKDKIIIGSRFSGTLYPNRSAISPDGRDFLYFAMGKSQGNYDKKYYCWTAICSPPLLKANLFLPHINTYSGGGYFIDENNIYISDGMKPELSSSTGISTGNYFGKYKITFDPSYNDGRWDSQKYGWSVTRKNKQGYSVAWMKECKGFIITKSVKKNWAKGGEYSMHEYTIAGKKGEILLENTDSINWADIDNYNRLILASGSEVKIFKDKKDLLNGKCSLFDMEEYIP